MSEVGLTRSGPPETVLPDEPDAVRAAIAAALAGPVDARRDALAVVCTDHPRSLSAWAHLGDAAGDDAEAYACYRVGYHRGLDVLRANGWRGSGYVRWDHESNRGFLRALAGLGATAGRIGESDESERCATFLRQLDPRWRDDLLDGPAG